MRLEIIVFAIIKVFIKSCYKYNRCIMALFKMKPLLPWHWLPKSSNTGKKASKAPGSSVSSNRYYQSLNSFALVVAVRIGFHLLDKKFAVVVTVPSTTVIWTSFAISVGPVQVPTSSAGTI